MKKTRNEAERVNRSTFICYLVEVYVIFIAYLIEVVKGNRTMGYFLTVAAAIVIPTVIMAVMLKKSPGNRYFRSVFTICFAILYGVVLLTTTNALTFTYVMPMLLVITMYNSVQLSLLANIGAVLMNIAEVIMKAVNQGGLSKEEITSTEIQILVVVFIGAYSIVANRMAQKTAQEKMDIVNQEKDHTAQLLDRVVHLSGDITEGIFEVQNQMESLGASVSRTLVAMEEVSNGNTETAEAVQNQLLKTEEIQNHITDVAEAAKGIISNVNSAKAAVGKGNDNINEMIEQVRKSEESGDLVVEELAKLDEYAQKMHSIVEMINNVADQTSLLSLNASIEAARAGEAGRGFAVVASEISSLANQTQEATKEIETLIANISGKLENVVGAVKTLVEANRKQVDTAQDTEKSFEAIEQETTAIADSSDAMHRIVLLLADANKEIVESIQSISAITEEVSAHASETYSGSEQNTKVVAKVSEIVTALSRQAKELTDEQSGE